MTKPKTVAISVPADLARVIHDLAAHEGLSDSDFLVKSTTRLQARLAQDPDYLTTPRYREAMAEIRSRCQTSLAA